MWKKILHRKKLAAVKQYLNMSPTQQAPRSKCRLSSTEWGLTRAAFTQTVCSIQSCVWFSDSSTTTHMLQVREKRLTAGLYLCECVDTTRQLYQHGLVILPLWWPSCAQTFPQRDTFALTSPGPLTVAARQLELMINWWRMQMFGLMSDVSVWLVCNTRAVYLEASYRSEDSLLFMILPQNKIFVKQYYCCCANLCHLC